MPEDPTQLTLSELAQIYGSVPLGLCFIDREMRYVRINDHLAAINGRPASEHIGRTLEEIIPKIAEVVVPVYRRVFKTGEPIIEMEMRGVTEATPRKERPYIVSHFPVSVEAGGGVDGVLTVVQDATEREDVRHKLRRADQILGQVHDAVIMSDLDGVIRTWNRAAERIYGYRAEEAIGRPINMLSLPEDSPTVRERLLRPVLEKGTYETAVRKRRKDGSPILVELRLSMLQNETGEPVGMIGCSNDVTERRRLQEELLKSTTAEQRRIGQELHDVTGQALTGLRYLCRSLVRSLGRSASPEVELAATLEKGLSEALEQVRGLSRGLVPVQVNADGLMEALSSLAANTRSINDVACSFSCDTPIQVRDNEMATQLYRIAQEAVTNAVKHSRARQILIRLARAGGSLSLEVVDDGVGLEIPPSADGLGMRTMSFRAEMIGATLRVLPTKDGGTMVVCTVPAPF